MPETHFVHRGAWLRAGVLGANDGIVSTASLVLGVAAADSSPSAVLVAGLAGLVGGALSMAAGEYVSVASQRDLEHADLARERHALHTLPEGELEELAGLYRQRGLAPALAREVAQALTAHDALGAHAREELNLDPDQLARPVLAAVSSAAAFAIGAALPLVAMTASPQVWQIPITLSSAVVALGALGGWSARLGGAPLVPAVARVMIGGALAMGLTLGVGTLFA